MKMKRFPFLFSMKCMLLVVALLANADGVFAQDDYETIGGLRYQVDAAAKTATLAKQSAGECTGEIVVPEKVTAKDAQTYTVVALCADCFNDCSGVTSITLPSSVTSLGDWCFYQCTGLTQLTLPSSITSLGDWCFYGCSNLKSVAISSTVASLGKGFFYDCTSLEHVSLPATITSLGDMCFYNCPSLESIELPSTVASLGEQCFYKCAGLKTVALPTTLTELKYGCFWNCSGLTKVTMPSVTSLAVGCFRNCTTLKSIVLPPTLTFTGDNSFEGCTGLTSVYFKGQLPDNLANANIPVSGTLYATASCLQAYKDALGGKYQNISEWTGEEPTEVCELPVISYADGELQFSCTTPGAVCRYSIADADVVSNQIVEDGKVKLSASYTITAYATADGYQPSAMATATLYWLNANLETNINQTKTRGVVAASSDGFVTISGLDNGESVAFFAPDGRLLTTTKAQNGIASCAVSGTMVIAKVGGNALKIAVKQ